MTRKQLGLRPFGQLPILALLLVAMAAAPAKAQTIRDWVDSSGGNYDDIANWSALNVPDTISESARFNIVGTYDVVHSSFVPITVSDLLVNNGDVTFIPNGLFAAIFTTDDDAQIIGGDLTLAKGFSGAVTMNVGDLLTVRGGSTLNVIEGSDVTAANLDLGTSTGTGTMIVDGALSSLVVTTSTDLGFAGSTGTLTFQNGTTGNSLSGTINLMANSGNTGSAGRLNVFSGSTLQTGSIVVGRSNSPTSLQEGALTVDGGSSTLTMTGASTLTVGDDINPNVVSDVIVSNSAVMSTGTGAILIQNSGRLDIQAGTFNANGNLTVDGGTITQGSASGGFNLASGLTLTAQNTAQINFGGAYSIDQGTTFDIQSGADFTTTGDLNIGNAGGNGTLIVDGPGSTVIQNGGSSLVVGHATSGTATINVQNGGTFTTGTSDTTVNATGTINTDPGGTFFANGNLTVNGGTVTGEINLASGLTLTATNDAQINTFGFGYILDQGKTVDIQSGADFTSTFFLSIGGSGGDGTLLVDGAGSSVTTEAGVSFWGTSGNTADVTFRNGAIGNLGVVFLANSAVSGSTAIFRVESGANVFANELNVATSNGATTSGTITVDGVDSSLTQNGASALTVGFPTDGTATVNVQNSGTFTTGTGLTTIDTTGTVNVNTGGTFNLLGNLDLFGTLNLVGGTLSAVDSDLTGGIFNFPFGTLELNGDQTLDAQKIADFKISLLDSGKTFRVNGVATLLTPLTLAGGTFTTESLVNPFLLDFQSGTFELTSDDLVVGPAGLFGSPLTVATGQAIKVTNTTTVESGATLVIESGGTFVAGTLANSGSVILNGPAATLGGTTLNNNAGGVVRGKGTISAAFNNNVNGELRGESGNTLLFTGTPGANAGQINLQGGTVQFAQALTNAAGGQITGRGTLDIGGLGLTNNGHIAFSSGITDVFGDVTNNTGSASIGITVSGNADVTFWDDVQNSSGRFQVSSGSSATFFGAFAGNGITGTGDVFMEADVTPGFSPGTQDFGGNVFFGPVASLGIEIAGLLAGSEFDQINVASLVSLDGTLDVTFIDGFMPTAGDTFEIITAASVLGVFDTVNLPVLSGDLLWFINYGATSVELVSTFAADFDEDGDVDGFDLAAWEGGFSSTPAVHMTGDANTDTSANGFDFLTWQRQFGNGGGTPLAVAATIPEPSSLLLAALGLLTLSARRKRT